MDLDIKISTWSIESICEKEDFWTRVLISRLNLFLPALYVYKQGSNYAWCQCSDVPREI